MMSSRGLVWIEEGVLTEGPEKTAENAWLFDNLPRITDIPGRAHALLFYGPISPPVRPECVEGLTRDTEITEIILATDPHGSTRTRKALLWRSRYSDRSSFSERETPERQKASFLYFRMFPL